MSLSEGQAQWLVDFMRHLPGGEAPPSQQPQVHAQPQHYDSQLQRHAEYETPYYESRDYQSYDEYPRY